MTLEIEITREHVLDAGARFCPVALALLDAGFEQPSVRFTGIEFVDRNRRPGGEYVSFAASEELTGWQVRALEYANREDDDVEPPEPFTLVIDQETGQARMKGEEVRTAGERK